MAVSLSRSTYYRAFTYEIVTQFLGTPMIFDALANRLNKKLYRREHRRMLQKWSADGGDDRLRYDYNLNRDSFVMDLGGYEGEWTNKIHSRYQCRVAVFEPVETFANSMRQHFNGNDDIEIFQCGLGGSSRTETIYLWGAGTSSFRKRAKAEEIRIVDVKEWFDEHQIASVNLLKINIEGGEFELLERMLEVGLVPRIENIQVQFHNIAVQSTRRMEAIQAGMEKTHAPTYQYKFVWENWKLKQ